MAVSSTIDSVLPIHFASVFSLVQSKYVEMHWCRLVCVYSGVHVISSIRNLWSLMMHEDTYLVQHWQLTSRTTHVTVVELEDIGPLSCVAIAVRVTAISNVLLLDAL